MERHISVAVMKVCNYIENSVAVVTSAFPTLGNWGSSHFDDISCHFGGGSMQVSLRGFPIVPDVTEDEASYLTEVMVARIEKERQRLIEGL